LRTGLAVGLAQRRQRQCEHHRIAHRGLEVDVVALDPPDLILLGGLGRGALRIDEQLVDPGVDLDVDRSEAADTLSAASPATVPET